MLADEWRGEAFAYMAGVLKNQGVFVVEIGGTADHIHALVGLRTRHSISDIVRTLKIASGTWIREERGCPQFAWQDGYGAFAVSREHVGTVRDYVSNQEAHHRKTDARSEFVALCHEHGIAADDRFVE